MKGKNDTMAKRILENGEIKDKKKINKSRIAGMTLIALVVTIIVIIILATVGITIGLGSGGVIEKAEVSKDIVKLSEYGTTIKMITANEYTNKMSNEKTGELKELVKNTLKKDEKWVKDVEDVKGDENKIKVITVEDYIIVAQIWDDGDLDIINAGKDNEEPYPVISIGQEVVDENTIKLKVIADVTTTDKTKGIDTVTFVNTGDAIKNYNKGDVLTFNVTKSGKYTFEAVTNMGKTTRQSVVVKIKSSEADIQIASEPTTSRNTLKTGKLNGVDAGPIEVSIDYGYTKLLKQYKLGEDGTWTNVDSQNVKLKVTDNMTVYARYFDGESKEVKLTSYDVANVDNIAPNAFGITATSTSNSITVNASTIDTANKGAKVGISGVKEYLYRIFRNESWGEWQSSKQFTDLPEGEYKVQAKAIDKAGNETISSNVVTLECKLQRAEVTFDNNDGSDKKQTVSKVVGTELGELPTVSREGYDFAGWYTDKTSGTKVTENTVVPETDVTYYARWTARNDTKYTVIHQQMNLDGTTYTTVDTEELKGKTDSKVTPDVKSYEGFTAPEKQEVTIKADGSTTVTYKYTRNKYTLTYNPNGGSVSPTSIKADYDAEITLPTPTRKYTITYNTNGGSSVTNSTVDYTFNGWYTKASEGDKRTYTKMPAYNETLYAQWASSGIALPTTNKAGYVLAGWYTDSALTSEVTLSDGKYIPTANITLYAKWEEVVITLNPISFTYDGTEKKPETTVKVGSKTLEKDKDYTVEYKNNINVGTATVTITGKGSYNGVTATTTFKINEKRITIPAGKTLTYNGEEQTGVDSKDEYKFSGTIKATNAGTYSATATLTDTANTKWSDETTEAKTISWKINAKKLSGNVTVSDVEDKTYTGSAITPEVEVKDTARNTVLTKNTDYTISYKNNVNAGTATITITGKGNYTGTVEKTFKINGDANPIKVTNKTVYTGSTVDLSTLVSDAQGDVTFSIKTNGTTTASTLSGSKLTAGAMSTTDDKDQTVVITAKAAGNGNYNPGNKDITITVQKYTATLSWTSTTPDGIIYGTTGKTATATVKVTEGTAGKVTYTSGSTDVLEIDANTGALTTKKVGSSEITAKMARTSTVKEASVKKTITVTAKKIEIPTGKTLTYNGEEQTGVDSKAEYRLSGTVKATNIGTYTATATLADANNTQWSDESATAKTISWKINAKNLSGNITISNIADQTYTRSAITPQPTVTDTARNKALTNNSDYTLSYKDNTTVGTATITITGKGNYTGTVEKTFKIVKASVVVPTQNGTLTYNGSSQSPKWNNYNTNLMTIGGTTSGTNAGNYNATFTLKDKTNYQWNGGATDDKTVEWRIGQRENTISVAGKTLTYNGKEQVLVTVSSAQGTVYYSIGTALTSSNYKTAGSTEMPKATNANTEGYKVYYYCEGDINNKAKSGNVTARINKATNPMGVTNKTVYAGSITDLTTAVVGAQGNVTFELTSSGTTTASTLSGSNLTAGTLSTTDDNAQTVVVKATAEGNNNYNAGSKNITITVQKYSVSLSWTSSTPSNIIYGTTGRTATVTATVAGGTKGKITYTSGTTDVLEIDANTGALTTKMVGSSEITASIARTSTVKPATTKKTITVVQNTNPITATGKTLTYNGKDQELITVSNAQGDVYYSVGTVLSNSNYQTAGSTTIPTKKDANVNGYVVYYYCVGNKNYSAKAGSVTTKINKANLTITADNKTMTYGGTVPTYTYTGTGFVNGETASVLGGTASYTVKNSSGTAVTISKTTNAGTYTITPSGLSSNNYNITYKAGTLTIGQETNPITVTNKTVYTGSTTDLSTLVSNAQGTITYKVKTNGTTTASTLSGSKLTAGAMSAENDNNQTVVVTVTAGGNTNYASGSKDLTITVQKYTPTLAWTSTTPSSIVYGTTGKTATVTATVSGGTKGAVTYTSGTTGVLTINSSTGALTTAGVGSSTITASIARTTTVKAGSIARTISVTKATNPITVTGNTLTYNGKAQNLVTTAKAQGAVYYSVGTSLTSSNYTTAGSTTIPTQTSANTSGYVVYYYCVGNGNYNAKSGNVTVKIAKAASVNPTLTDVSVPYDTKAHAISVSGGSGGTIYYRTSTDNSTWGSWTTTKPTRTSVGTTYVQAYVKGDSNHSDTSATASKKITIQTSYWKNTTKGTYYATTASAISAAAANDTLELQRNFTDAGTVSINKTLYIDLSSYTWTKTTSTITITSAGMVYLGADKGKITTSGAFNLITNAGKFYLGGPNTFSGSLTRTNASSDYSVVYNTGTYSQASTSTVITSTGIGIYNNGGDVSIQTGTIDANYHAIKNHAGTLEINGGGVTITGNKGTDVTWSAVCNDEGATMTLKSGTITGSNHQGISNYGTCTISGGTVKSGKASNAITNQSTGKVTITGGTISTTTGYAIRSLSTQTAAVSVSGGTVTSSTTNGTILNEASGTVTLSGGTIENTNLNQGDVVPTIRNTSTGKIKIDGATVKTGGYGVYNTGAGAVELSSGSIGYSGSTPKYIGNVGIYTTGTGKITMSGGSITSMEDGINSKGNSITISKGTISAKYTGVKMLGSSLVISGQSSTTTIESGDIGVSATKNVNITITGGSIKGTNYGIQRNTVISGNTTLGTLNIGTISSTSENNPLIYGGTAIQSNTAVNCYSGLVSGAGLCITGSTITVGGATTNKTNSPTIILRGNASSTKPVISTSGGITYYSGRIGATGGTYVKVDDDTKTPIMFKCFGWTNKSKSSISYNSMPAANAPTITVNGTKYSMTPYNSLTYTK